MATSAKPNLPNDDNNVQVYGLGMGDITIGLSGPQMAASQQLPGTMMNDLGGSVNPYLNNPHLSTQQNVEPRGISHLSANPNLDNSATK